MANANLLKLGKTLPLCDGSVSHAVNPDQEHQAAGITANAEPIEAAAVFPTRSGAQQSSRKPQSHHLATYK